MVYEDVVVHDSPLDEKGPLTVQTICTYVVRQCAGVSGEYLERCIGGAPNAYIHQQDETGVV